MAVPTRAKANVDEAPFWLPETCCVPLLDEGVGDAAAAESPPAVASLLAPVALGATELRAAVYCCRAIEAVSDPNCDTRASEIEF